ncbi:hypothetical protein QFC21_002486 [Naganishia friedmannii]|uniref:Uncharacterized protein n=1 Tax=Naganishia friedmannii TaxID=89922 RepID=A0ACC2VVN0_9TREE|nr:hypothetical protein QFC21_002486 [Naganishia friedmannii]
MSSPKTTPSSTGSTQWSTVSSQVAQSIEQAIQEASDKLRAVSLDIHSHPELGWEEHHAHDALTEFMEKQGFQVERHAYGMDTAWKATYEVGQGGRTIGFNSEMDALMGIGHACGHNLIAISGCAAALGVAAALKKHNIAGKIVLLGTPAEEGGGGKTELLARDAYKGMDACLMIHPGTGGNGSGSVTSTSIVGFTVTYKGKSAHAGGAPEKGINALDAAVAAYVNISVLRQQVPGTNRIHGVIAGSENWSANVIPGEAQLKYGVRAPTAREVMDLVPRVLNCFKAAALSSGCTHEITISHAYLDLQPCTTLETAYQEFCKERWGSEGYDVSDRTSISASTDFGDVTYHLPGLHPMFHLPNAHGGEFPPKAPEAHQAALKAATGIAVVGARIVVDGDFAQETRKTWEKQMTDIESEKVIANLKDLLAPYRKQRE